MHSRENPENPHRENPHVFGCAPKNKVLTRIVGYQERSVLTVLTSIVHVSSGRQERSRIGTYRACIEKVKSGVLRTGTYSRYSHVSNGSNFACSERACIVIDVSCMPQTGPIWGACIVMYRKRRFGSCIEYVYRGARSIHIFGIGKVHEIHARYKGKQNGGGARHNAGQKEGNTRRYTNLGENRPHIWGKSDRYPPLPQSRELIGSPLKTP